MQNVTGSFLLYRNSARSVWNVAFWPYEALRNWDSRDHFVKIRRILFEAIVLDRVNRQVPQRFLVIPRADQIPIMIEQPREHDRNRYWDAPVTHLRREAAVLEFIDFFDWDQLGLLDFRYY